MVLTTDRSGDLTEAALGTLLNRLGPNREAACLEYEAIRLKLMHFFDRRGMPMSDALADETLDRVARRIDEGEAVEHPRAYCYGVARRVLLEREKRRAKEAAALSAAASFRRPEDPPEVIEARVSCLERCLQELPPESRDLIVRYYEGEGNVHLDSRHRLADTLSVTYATLKTRAYRIRTQLHECLLRCLENRRDL
jgi:DNA-directed RNA polymerase specialized sigma24 family protein